MYQEKDIHSAFVDWWFRFYPAQAIDEAVIPYRKLEMHGGWLKGAREALFLTQHSVATKAGTSVAALQQAEGSENVTLETLRKYAAAMDCEFVYAIRPKEGGTFSQRIWDRLFERILTTMHVPIKPRRMDSVLTARAHRLMTNAKFRREMGWARNSS